MRMSAMNVGPLTCDKGLLVAFASGETDIPTTAVVIEHPKHGVVLWDTGIYEAVADPDRRADYWGAVACSAFKPDAFTRDHVIDAQLDRLGIKTSDVNYVIYSHLHLDHAGGMSYFPGATHVVQRDEIRYALWPDQWTRPIYCQKDFSDIRKLDILEIDGDLDLFNDGSIRLVRTPGHTIGHQSMILDLPNRGRVCLGADIGHQRGGFENMTPFPWDWSVSAMSLTRKRMMHMERSGVPLFLCHDAGDFGELPSEGEFWD